MLMNFAVHLGGGVVGVVSVPFFSHEYGILYKWDLQSAYVSTYICTPVLIKLLMTAFKIIPAYI